MSRRFFFLIISKDPIEKIAKQWSLLNCELSLTSYFRGDASFVGLERIGSTWKWSNGDTASSLVWSNNSDTTVTCAALMKDTKYLAVPCTSANQYIGGCVVPHAGKKNTTLVLDMYLFSTLSIYEN